MNINIEASSENTLVDTNNKGPSKGSNKDIHTAVSEGVSESTSESESFIQPKDIAIYVLRYLSPLIIAVLLSIIFFFYFRKKGLPMWKLVGVLLIPLFAALIYLFNKYAPQPKHHFLLSVLYDDKPIYTGFKHKKKNTWTFIGSAVINIDGLDHIFIGGGEGQDDVLLIYDKSKKKFRNLIQDTGLSSKSATFSAVSIDMDNNGLDDLIIGRKDGVYLYKQHYKYKFTGHKIFHADDKIPTALSVSDYNKDGKADIYVSYFVPIDKYRGTIFNDPSHNRSNVLLKNSSSADTVNFIDVTLPTKSGGISNTFTSAFVDLNNDGYPDLVLSHDSSEIEILKNIDGKHFESIIPFQYKGNWMGIAVGDIDNDGYQDLFLTNLGIDIDRDKFALGDIKEGQTQGFAHALLQNDGQFKFVDVMNKKGIHGSGFGWGAVMADLNLDSNLDLLYGENFMANPIHHIIPGVGYLYNLLNGTYKRSFKYKNPHFAQTPILADLNQDNIKDIVWINMQGPAIAYLNKNKGNFINVRLPETSEFANAKVTLDTGSTKFYKEIIQGGIGFGSDGSNIITFGLGDLTSVKEIRVKTIHGKVYFIKDPKINSIVTLKKIK